MSSKTKIIVLHMKEILPMLYLQYAVALLIILLVVMFRPGGKKQPADAHAEKQYTPGIYTSALTLNNTNLEVEVSVDESHINSIRFSNLDESIATMFPLIQPAIEDIAEQIYKTQSLENITLSEQSPYTSQVILDAIAETVEKAAVD